MTDTLHADGLAVGQVSTRLGVTVRALHHWDEIGLAQPSVRTDAGYRLYTAGDLGRLQRIIVYRAVGLRLDAIRALLDEAASDVPAALSRQRDQVAEQITRLQRLSVGLDRMIDAHEHGLLLTAEQQATIFGPQWDPQWPAQAHERWAHTKQWAQYAEGSATRTAEQWQQIADATSELDRDLADAIGADIAPGSQEANRLIERHREVFSSYFPLTREMQVCLGRMYEADPAYAAHYDGIRPGLAAWLHRAIDASARAHGIDPETAIWQ